MILLDVLRLTCSAFFPLLSEGAGCGLSGDSQRMTPGRVPHPASTGVALAMRKAVGGSGAPAGSTCYINAQTTSTPVE